MTEPAHKKMILENIARFGHLIFSVALSLFFMYAAIKKFIPKASVKPLTDKDSNTHRSHVQL